jgi:hypothetical protein
MKKLLLILLVLSLFVSADLFAVITRWQDVEIVNGRVIVEDRTICAGVR